MNSPPRRITGYAVAASAIAAMASVAHGRRSAQRSCGRYATVSQRTSGLASSPRIRPRIA